MGRVCTLNSADYCGFLEKKLSPCPNCLFNPDRQREVSEGLRGPKGDKGDKGDTVIGPMGPPGIKGEGKDGRIGVIGLTGSPGLDGRDGRPGTSIKGDKGDEGASGEGIDPKAIEEIVKRKVNDNQIALSWGSRKHAKALHNSATLPGSANEDFGGFYYEMDEIAVPSDPAASTRRVFLSSKSGLLSVQTSGGLTSALETFDAVVAPGESIATALTNGARSIFVLNGTHTITTQINLSQANIVIVGESRAGVLLDGDATDIDIFNVTSDAQISNLTFRNLTGDGAGVKVSNGGSPLITNCAFSSPQGVIIAGTVSAVEASIVDCKFSSAPGSDEAAIFVSNFATFVNIIGCDFQVSGSGSCISVIGQTTITTSIPDVLVVNCFSSTALSCDEGWFLSGVHFANDIDPHFTLINNNIRMNGGPVCNIDRGGGVISGNVFNFVTNTLADGINLSGGEGTTVSSNFLDGGSKATDIIEIAGDVGHQVTNNIFVSAVTNAIHVSGSGDNCVVSNNTMKGQTLIIDSGVANSIIAFNILNTLTENSTLGDNEVASNVTGIT